MKSFAPSLKASIAQHAKRKTQYSSLLGVSLRQRALCYRQLHSLLRAGIPLAIALQHTAEASAFPLRKMVQRLSEHVMQGGRLSEQLAAFPQTFPEWEVSVMRAAELSGSLPEATAEIASTLEMEYEFRTRITAVTLPARATALVAMLVGLILGSLGGAAGEDVFARLGHAVLVFACLMLGLFGAKYLWRVFAQSRKGAAFLSALLPALPLIGPIQSGMARIRFVRTLASLWKAGVPPLETLETAAATSGNPHFMRQMAGAPRQMSDGAAFSNVLSKTDFLPEETLYMLRTGETSGTVAESLETVAEYFTIELEAKIHTLPGKLLLIYYLIIVPIVFLLCLCAYACSAGGF